MFFQDACSVSSHVQLTEHYAQITLVTGLIKQICACSHIGKDSFGFRTKGAYKA